jgi:membrane protease YdiL (CAAX protease family)
MPARLILLVLGLSLLIGSLSAAAVQIVLLERGELEYVSEFRSLDELASTSGATRISVRLGEVELAAGEQSLFELCAQAPMRTAGFRDVITAVAWLPAKGKLELKVPLDAAHLELAKQSGSHSCLTLGGGKVAESGRYALDLTWAGHTPSPELRRIPLRAHILARHPLGLREGLLVLSAALGAMLSVLSAFVPDDSEVAAPRRRTPAFALLGTVVALVLVAVVLRLPLAGAVGGFARGMALALIEAGVALGFAFLLYRSPRAGLSLHAPNERSGLWLLVAAGSAAVLNPLARLAMSVVPATGEAPIEAFISWPSGALAFAALGMAVPLSEELFFRGFVFGALRPLGTLAAAIGTMVLFSAAHAQQAWGNWGALLSVTLTGVLLTSLRAVTGSTLVPAVAHLLYNLSLWKDSFRG